MGAVKINRERCKGCALCTTACKLGLLKMGEEVNAQGYRFVLFKDDGTCKACKLCAEMCPDLVITVFK